MQQYDVVLKLLLQQHPGTFLNGILGFAVETWLPIELPKVQNARLDLLGESAAGELVHIELQSSNDAEMALRMAEYFLAIYRQHGRFARQVVLYVGPERVRMPEELPAAGMKFRYEMVDVRSFDGDKLIESPKTSDNVFAVLASLRQERLALRRILRKLSQCAEPERRFYLEALLTLAGLRGLGRIVEEEGKNMPILNDIMDHEVLGREFKRGVEVGRQEARLEGEIDFLRLLLQSRFGDLPPWVDENLMRRSEAELKAIVGRIWNVNSLEDLLR